MAKDRRVEVEGQDLPCVRSDAADSATISQAREEDMSHSSSGNKSPLEHLQQRRTGVVLAPGKSPEMIKIINNPAASPETGLLANVIAGKLKTANTD